MEDINKLKEADFGLPNDEQFSEILQNDFQAFTPPSEAKNAVFAALNIPLPNTAPTGANGAEKIAPSLLLLLKRAAIPVAVGLMITLSGYFYFNSASHFKKGADEISTITNQNTSIQNPSELSIQKENNLGNNIIDNDVVDNNTVIVNGDKNVNMNKIKANIPMASSSKTEKAMPAPVGKKNTINNRNTENIENTVNIENSDFSTNQVANQQLNNIYGLSSGNLNNNNINNNSRNQDFPINRGENLAIPSIFSTDVFSATIYSDTKKFELCLKGIAASTLEQSSKFGEGVGTSFIVGGFMPMSEGQNFNVGVLIGKEPFFKKFFNKEEPSIVESYASPSVLWFAIAAKYRLGEVGAGFFSFKPFAEIALGAGELGPLSRLSAGIEKPIFGGLSASVSADFSAMFYNNRYEWFASKKMGISAGLIYSF